MCMQFSSSICKTADFHSKMLPLCPWRKIFLNVPHMFLEGKAVGIKVRQDDYGCLAGSFLRLPLHNSVCNSACKNWNAFGVFCDNGFVLHKSRTAFNHSTTSPLHGRQAFPLGHAVLWERHLVYNTCLTCQTQQNHTWHRDHSSQMFSGSLPKS